MNEDTNRGGEAGGAPTMYVAPQICVVTGREGAEEEYRARNINKMAEKKRKKKKTVPPGTCQ